jgi:hypothetical protein
MKTSIMLSAILAAFALGGCQKTDVNVTPETPSGATSPATSSSGTGGSATTSSSANYSSSSDSASYADSGDLPPPDVPSSDIGMSVESYPQLDQVPGYPVYYAPSVNGNYFFYDGMFWVFQRDNWYASTWYNGPWGRVAPDYVPLYILRVPVHYYHEPPSFFRGWAANDPPQWGNHYGHGWEQHHSGWNQWNHGAVPAAAPLPTYQRQFAGGKYPPLAQQHELRAKEYHYQPKDAQAERVFHAQTAPKAVSGRPQPGVPPQNEAKGAPGQFHEVPKAGAPQPGVKENEKGERAPKQPVEFRPQPENKGAPPPQFHEVPKAPQQHEAPKAMEKAPPPHEAPKAMEKAPQQHEAPRAMEKAPAPHEAPKPEAKPAPRPAPEPHPAERPAPPHEAPKAAPPHEAAKPPEKKEEEHR